MGKQNLHKGISTNYVGDLGTRGIPRVYSSALRGIASIAITSERGDVDSPSDAT